ncbi:MAG: hypothetical protein V3W41_22475 [Planctomycetota bacterium]
MSTAGSLERWFNFLPPGPVAEAYLKSQKRIVAIMGPVAGGKTWTTCVKLLNFAAAQRPSPIDGIARFRCLCVRNVYKELEDTTIPTWHEIVPANVGKMTGGKHGEPGKHALNFDVKDLQTGAVKPVKFEILFRAIGDKKVEDVCRGIEPTCFWLNEADLVSPLVFPYALTRLNRYPGNMHGGPDWTGILMDYNAPDTENYVYTLTEETKPESLGFFRQPGGLDAGAENLMNLRGGRAHYERMLEDMKGQDWLIRRMIHNQYGYSRDGLPVYEKSYDDTRHVSHVPLTPIGRRLVVAFDAGRTPAAILLELGPDNEVRILGELVCENMGATLFAPEVVSWLAELAPGADIDAVADPSACFGNDAGEETWVDIMMALTGLDIQPAFTNDIDTRIQAVETALLRNVAGGKPGLIMDPRCKVLRKGFNSGYCLKRKQISGVERYADKPDKDSPFSHPHDGLQYGVMEVLGENALRGREDRGFKRRVEQRQRMDREKGRDTWSDDPLGGFAA